LKILVRRFQCLFLLYSELFDIVGPIKFFAMDASSIARLLVLLTLLQTAQSVEVSRTPIKQEVLHQVKYMV